MDFSDLIVTQTTVYEERRYILIFENISILKKWLEKILIVEYTFFNRNLFLDALDT